MKPGPKTADRVGQIYAGWQVIANAGMLDKKNTFWRLQNLQTKELVTIRGDKLKIWKGERLGRVLRKSKSV